MMATLKIFMILLACMGLAHTIGNGDRTKTALVFFCIAFLVWHLESQAEINKVTVVVDGHTLVENGRVVKHGNGR